MSLTETLLSVRDLRIELREDAEENCALGAIDGVSFNIARSERVGLVGESGAGKSLIAHSILGLLRPTARISAGAIVYRNADITHWSDSELRSVRGKEIALIPQDPALALTPVVPVGTQLTEVIKHHLSLSRAEARELAIEKLRIVGIGDPERRLHAFPHELSGGMKQRVAIAIALSCSPQLLIADEPTSGVDVTIQAQILDELIRLTDELGLAVLFITHDLRVVSTICARTIVLYGGQIAAEGPTQAVLRERRHPYVDALINCSPTVERRAHRLAVVPGAPPAVPAIISGCRFHPRCAQALEKCSSEAPVATVAFDSGRIFCWNPVDGHGIH